MATLRAIVAAPGGTSTETLAGERCHRQRQNEDRVQEHDANKKEEKRERRRSVVRATSRLLSPFKVEEGKKSATVTWSIDADHLCSVKDAVIMAPISLSSTNKVSLMETRQWTGFFKCLIFTQEWPEERGLIGHCNTNGNHRDSVVLRQPHSSAVRQRVGPSR
jgi:hypothetical protein